MSINPLSKSSSIPGLAALVVLAVVLRTLVMNSFSLLFPSERWIRRISFVLVRSCRFKIQMVLSMLMWLVITRLRSDAGM